MDSIKQELVKEFIYSVNSLSKQKLVKEIAHSLRDAVLELDNKYSIISLDLSLPYGGEDHKVHYVQIFSLVDEPTSDGHPRLPLIPVFCLTIDYESIGRTRVEANSLRRGIHPKLEDTILKELNKYIPLKQKRD